MTDTEIAPASRERDQLAEIVTYIVGAPVKTTSDAGCSFSFATEQHRRDFDRLLGDLLCGPIAGQPNATDRAAQAEAAMRDMAGDGQFLLDRLAEFAVDNITEKSAHDWFGFVTSAIRRLRNTILSTPTAAVALAEREVIEAGRTNAIRREAQRDGRWPDAVSDGLTIPCHDCGATPRFDYGVTDEFWRQWVPGPERTSVVCLPCLDKRCGGVGLAKALGEIHWTGTGHTVVLSPTFRHEYAARAKAEGAPATPADTASGERRCEYAPDLIAMDNGCIRCGRARNHPVHGAPDHA